MNSKRDNRKHLIHKLQINKLVVRELQNRKFYTLTLTLVMLLATFGLSPAFSSLMRNVTIRSSGTITTILPLHVEGKYIKNSLGNIVYLRGVCKHGMEDHPFGHWQRLDGGVSYFDFNPDVVAANLDAMKSGGINLIRIHSTVKFWKENTQNHRQIIKDLATMCAKRGIYLIYEFYHCDENAGQTAMPFPPYNKGEEQVIASETEFVEVWRSIATELKDYPNVIFEFFNEPTGMEGKTWEQIKTDWQRVWQACINAVRQTGATNLIIVQFGYGIYANLQAGDCADMSWVWEYPLNDPLGNLVYSTHLYRSEIFKQTEPEYICGWTYEDVMGALEMCKVIYVLNNLSKPVLFGEIGPNMWQEGEEYVRELAFYNNSLTMFNSLRIHYAAFWWWPSGPYAHLTLDPNYQPNDAGEILKNALSQS